MCDLPCHDIIFNEKDPFTHPSFTFSRNLTALTSFRALFEDTDKLELTMLDTFVLIHRKLAYHLADRLR